MILIILFLTTGFCASAQEVTIADSTSILVDKVEHSPRKATIYSAVLPGLGQIYNKKYWKVPIIYAGFAALAYYIDWNNDFYMLYKQAYSDILDTDPNTNSFVALDIDGVWDFEDANQVAQYTTRLKSAKELTRRNRDLVMLGTVVFYAVNIIDATVDAHFFNFDVSDDLTVNWAPAPVYCFDQPLVGVHLRVRF